MNRFFTACRNVLRKSRVERDLDAELRAYLDQLTNDNIRAGMSPTEARRAAMIELGGVEQVKEEVRAARRGRLFEELLQDLRYGVRTLARNPGFTAVAVLALAVGIGANTAMFSVVYGILLRPLPYPDADRVATVSMRFHPQNAEFGTLCVADYLDWRTNNHAFEDPSVFTNRRMDLAGTGDPEQVQGAAVTAGFFSTLQVRPLLGRVFLPGDDRPGSAAQAVLSESLWRRRFDASPTVLGKSISVSGSQATIIGVMPAGFGLPRETTELWTNLQIVPPTRRGPFFYRGIARLKPGVTLDQAQAETNAIGLRIMRENPYYKNLKLPVLSLRETLVGRVKTPLLVLIGAVGLVLLIAVGNVANLMLARATVREREMALRLSLGAGRGRLIRQLLTESVLLAVAGGAAGTALAYACIQLLRAWNPGNLPLAGFIQIDSRALGFMLVVSLLTGILFGLAPAWHSARADLNSTLKEGGRTTSGRARRHTRAALVVAEVALSLMLLVGAGLLLRSLALLERVTGGFAAPPHELLTMAISPTDRKYNTVAVVRAYYDRVIEHVRRLPGVQSAAISDSLPPTRQADADTFMIQGRAMAPGETNPAVSKPTVGPGYFETMRIPLLKGRYFTEHDTENSAPVVIISETLARSFFPGQDPIGQRIKQSGPDEPYMEIVGVVGDVKYTGLQRDTDAAHYIPYGQSRGRQMFLVVRTSLGVAALAPVLRREIQSIDPGVTLNAVSTMRQALDADFAQPRFNTILLALFAGIALLLAVVGIYGVIAYSVAQRTHEIGVRMALGAGRANVLGMVIRQGARLALLGIALGLTGAFILTRLLATLLFGVSPTDPLTFIGVALGLLAVALLATFIPAHRATRISPIVALRYE